MRIHFMITEIKALLLLILAFICGFLLALVIETKWGIMQTTSPTLDDSNIKPFNPRVHNTPNQMTRHTEPMFNLNQSETNFQKRPNDRENSPIGKQGQMLNKIKEDLNLTEDQYQKVRTIMNYTQTKIKSIQSEVREQIKNEFENSEEKIMDILNPDQQEKFKIIIKNRPRPSMQQRRGPKPEF